MSDYTEPASVTVTMDTGVRIHVLDWSEPEATPTSPARRPAVLLVHGLQSNAWTWLPIARRLVGRARVLAPDLRGHGQSESPTDGYDLDSQAFDVLTILTAHGLGPDAGGPPAVLVGHGFGAQLVAWAARMRPAAASSVVLVDGGWEALEATLRMDAAEFLRGLSEPPEVLASMDALLADRRDWDHESWDADQERAVRATVNETYAGRVTPVVRRRALAGCVDAMFAYRPLAALGELARPLTILVAEPGGADDDEARERRLALDDVLDARRRAGLPESDVRRMAGSAHNLMRYRPDEVSTAILDWLPRREAT